MYVLQEAQKVRQRRSRIVQIFNVPQRILLGLHSLEACWTAFLSILREYSAFGQDVQVVGDGEVWKGVRTAQWFTPKSINAENRFAERMVPDRRFGEIGGAGVSR
jgi:hypothetical protein